MNFDFFQSVVIYGLVLIVMFLCGGITNLRCKHNIKQYSYYNWDVWIPIVFFTLIFGLRYDVGADHLRYLYAYTTGIGVERYEIIFQSIAKTFKSIDLHYFYYFSLWVFIQIFCLYSAFKKDAYLLPFVAISLIMGQYFIHWMNGIRQDTAACIFFYSILYIVEKKFFYYMLCCMLAIGLHNSAILLIPLYFILKSAKDLTFNRKIQFIILLLSFIVAIAKKDYVTELFPYINMFIVDSDYSRYSEGIIEGYNDKTKGGEGLSFKILFVINVLIIYYSTHLKQYFASRKFKIYYNLYYWGAVFQLFFINNLLLARPFRYFRLFNMVMIAYLLFYLYQNKYVGKNLLILISVITLLSLLFVATCLNEPYYFLWDK